MKTCLFFVLLLLMTAENALFAEENVIAFRLAYEYEKPDTFVVLDKDVGRLFVQNVPIIETTDISKARVIVDNTNPPAWLDSAIKSVGGRILQPQVSIAITLNAHGKETFSKITADNIGNRIAIFINNKLIMSPKIIERIDSEEVVAGTSFTEAEAQAIVDKINSNADKRR
jgi:preprotein translocase subunit SecD